MLRCMGTREGENNSMVHRHVFKILKADILDCPKSIYTLSNASVDGFQRKTQTEKEEGKTTPYSECKILMYCMSIYVLFLYFSGAGDGEGFGFWQSGSFFTILVLRFCYCTEYACRLAIALFLYHLSAIS